MSVCEDKMVGHLKKTKASAELLEIYCVSIEKSWHKISFIRREPQTMEEHDHDLKRDSVVRAAA